MDANKKILTYENKLLLLGDKNLQEETGMFNYCTPFFFGILKGVLASNNITDGFKIYESYINKTLYARENMIDFFQRKIVECAIIRFSSSVEDHFDCCLDDHTLDSVIKRSNFYAQHRALHAIFNYEYIYQTYISKKFLTPDELETVVQKVLK